MIKLAHFGTKYLLHSHEIAYGSGSGQQSVTGYPTGDDANSLWIVRGPKVLIVFECFCKRWSQPTPLVWLPSQLLMQDRATDSPLVVS